MFPVSGHCVQVAFNTDGFPRARILRFFIAHVGGRRVVRSREDLNKRSDRPFLRNPGDKIFQARQVLERYLAFLATISSNNLITEPCYKLF